MTKTKLYWLCAIWFAGSIAAFAGEPKRNSCASPHGVERCQPVGGWFPYGGGLLSWWPGCCYPNCGAPNDYCRKPLPKVCWPPYSPDYTWTSDEPYCSEPYPDCSAR